MLTPDRTFEGTESFTVKVSSGTSTGAVIESNTITVTDTSAQDYTMSIPTITEGSDLIVNVSANAGSSEVLYFEISGTAASKFSSTQYTHSLQATGLSTFDVNLGTSSTNTTYEGNPTGTVTLSRGGYVGGGGTLITSTTFIVQDVTSTFTLTADTTTPSEGGTINFTVGGTNIANGTYYRRITDIIAAATTQIIPSGVSSLQLADTSGITIGMETNTGAVTGTVTFVDATTVTMSNGVSSAVSSGATLQFANPSVFEDFSSGSSGTVNVTSNAGAFALVTATNTDTINDVYTMGLYTSESSNTPVASVGFTTTELTLDSQSVTVGSKTVYNPGGYGFAPNQTLYEGFFTIGEIQGRAVAGTPYDFTQSSAIDSTRYGSISDGTSNLYSGAAIEQLFYTWNNLYSAAFLNLTIAGNRANSGWTTLTVNGTAYLRADAAQSTDIYGRTQWIWGVVGDLTGSENPFPGTNGVATCVFM